MQASSLLSRRHLLLGAASACGSGFVAAQTPYPSRPIRLLVGYSAGGGVDVLSRLFATRMSSLLGQQVIVDNRAGAAGLLAAETAAKAPADGYTLFAGDTSLLVLHHLQKMSIDPMKAFHWLAGLFDVPLAIVVGNEFPAKTPREFVEVLKRNPAKYSYATSGVGTLHHLGFEMLKSQSKTFVVHIPYRGASQIVPDVISGHVPIGVVSVSSAIAQARAGRLRAIALMSSGKVAGAEHIPPLADALPGFEAVPRLFLLSPTGVPADIVSKLSEAARVTMGQADMPAAAAALGAIPAYTPANALQQNVVTESALWGKVISEQKINAQ